MHVAFVTPEYPINSFKGAVGGIGTFTRSLAERLVKCEIQVTVFIHSQSEQKDIVINSVHIYFVKKKSFKGITWFTNRLHFNRYVNKIILAEKINVIEAPEWTGFTAFMKFKCSFLIRLHGSDTYFCKLENRNVKFKNRFFESKALKGADKLIGVSKFVSNQTELLFNLKSEINVIYNTVDTKVFKPNHEEIKPKSLLYFGTIVRKKGVLEIAQMFNKLVKLDSEVTLILLGADNLDVLTGKSTLKLIKEILSEEALKRMRSISAIPHHCVIEYVQKSDLILLPSFAEAFPMTWLEAMSLEKKIVASDIGWSKELMVDGVTGYTINPINTNLFVSKVMELLQNPIKASQMGRSARERIINEFDMTEVISQNIKLYKSIIKC
ncbi:glycosyltransferase family 4 protein [Olleya namhaensis]|uniref:glycosyltransferase family 4 protein n=1 Tax=Olleya namhaensis TaxID=1144750 RepID=UPI002330E916|nr:glycosyltransferase family 4 protein [Olleya namhaensis]